MVIALVVLAVLLGAATVLVIRYEREMRRMARFLRERPQASNARVTTSIRSVSAIALVLAVNEKLDDIQRERLSALEREREMQHTLASLSHDIRTPLAGAQGYLELLNDETDPSIQTRYLGVAANRLDEVHQLLDQLFAYTRAHDTSLKLKLEPVDLGNILGDTLMGFYPQFAEVGWVPVVEIDSKSCTVQANREALMRIFQNLTDNALKYGLAAPRITQCEAQVTFANQVESPESLNTAQLFDRFYRADFVRTTQGSGLGLAIVAELVQAMSAKIEAKLVDDELFLTLSF